MINLNGEVEEKTMTSEAVEESLKDLLDESYEPLKIGDLTFYPSQIVADCDPAMWRIMLSEHETHLEEDGWTITD